MTDNEVIKGLKCCEQDDIKSCDDCPYYEKETDTYCVNVLIRDALDLINRQKAEIERLRKQLDAAEICIWEVEDAAYRGGSNDYIDEAIEGYNNLVKEMTGKDDD